MSSISTPLRSLMDSMGSQTKRTGLSLTRRMWFRSIEQLEGGTAPRLAIEILSETRRYAFIILSKRMLFVISCRPLCRRIVLLHKLANTQSTANLDLLQKLLLFLVLPQ